MISKSLMVNHSQNKSLFIEIDIEIDIEIENDIEIEKKERLK